VFAADVLASPAMLILISGCLAGELVGPVRCDRNGESSFVALMLTRDLSCGTGMEFGVPQIALWGGAHYPADDLP
jgi:hypothetical protein